jgi:hypothetical protein
VLIGKERSVHLSLNKNLAHSAVMLGCLNRCRMGRAVEQTGLMEGINSDPQKHETA